MIRRCMILTAAISTLITLPPAAHASDMQGPSSLASSCSLTATLTNEETGRSLELPASSCQVFQRNEDSTPLQIANGSDYDTDTPHQNFTVSDEISITTEDLELIANTIPKAEGPGTITPLSTVGGSNTKGVVTARLNINYDLAGTNVRVNRYYGTITNNYPTTFLEKSLAGGDGIGFGYHTIHRSNIPASYSYSTGWGYVPKGVGSLAPGGHLTIRFAPDGMAQTTLEVHVSIL